MMKKLWYSYLKELKLASRGFYFYVEILMAVIILLVMLFLVPEEFSTKMSEYIYIDAPDAVTEYYTDRLADNATVGVSEVTVKADGEELTATLYESETDRIYIMGSEEDLKLVAEKEKKTGAVISMTDEGPKYDYYLQGYESKRFKNILLTLHNQSLEELEEDMNSQKIVPLGTDYNTLTDKQNVVPAILIMNGGVMGMFIITAYIFLDKFEGAIKAFAVTASTVREYLLSKMAIVITTTVVVSLIISVPILGFNANYLALTILLIVSGYFITALGLLIASYYDNISQAFGVIYILIILLGVPVIAYYIPSFSPKWLTVFPTYWLLEGFKESIISGGDMMFVTKISLVFLVIGTLIFLVSNYRYKRTLTV